MKVNNNILTASEGMALLRKSDGWYMPHGVELKEGDTEGEYVEVAMEDVDFDKEPSSVETAKRNKLAELEVWDTSSAVQTFECGGTQMWADRAVRDTIRASVEACVSLGDKECSFTIGEHLLTMPCADALTMLQRLQRYGMQCNAAKARARAEILAMRRVSVIKGYDCAQYYPEVVRV